MLRSFLGFLPVSDSYFLSLQLLKNRNEINSNFITAKNVSSKRFMYTALRHEFCTALHIFMKFSISEIWRYFFIPIGFHCFEWDIVLCISKIYWNLLIYAFSFHYFFFAFAEKFMSSHYRSLMNQTDFVLLFFVR